MPKVTVAIPTYNGAKYIKECVESVLSQTYGDFELIVCDDCSSDNTLEIIRSIRDPRIKIHANEKNLGIGGNWNRCLELSKGELINIFHQDDVMMKNNLIQKVKFLKKFTFAAFVHSNFNRVDSAMKLIDQHWAKNPNKDCLMTSFDEFNRLIFEDDNICCPSVLIRKRCHEQLGNYNVKYKFSLDLEMWGRIVLDYDIGYIAEPLIQYRWHAVNTTHNFQGENSVKGHLEEYLVRESLLDRYSNHPKFPKKIDKFKIAEFYRDMGNFFFWQNDFTAAHRAYLKMFQYGNGPLKAKINYLMTRLPARLVVGIKKMARKTGTCR